MAGITLILFSGGCEKKTHSADDSSSNTTCSSTPTLTSTHTYTGSTATFVVPAGIGAVTVKAWGAGGAGGGQGCTTCTTGGGGGGYATGCLAVTPGQTLTLVV